MIIPVGINHVIRGWPWVTIGIIAMCTLVQIYSDAWAPSPEAVEQMIEHRTRDLPPGADAAQEAAVAKDVERIQPSAPRPSTSSPARPAVPPKRPVESPRPEPPADPAGGPRFLT